jgi:hypothetical protein
MGLRAAAVFAGSAIVFAFAVSGCPGSLDDPDRFFPCGGEGEPVCTTSTSTVPPLDEVFRPRCGLVGCHGGALPQSDLDLASIGIETRLVGRTSSTSACIGRTYVVAGAPEQSLIWQKITQNPPPCGTSVMPPTAPLSASEQDLVRAWIEGAGR